ncbi:TIGR03617 family F420-dependent LLM class oxidoreductase [Rhodococcus sp. 14C212]|uniref:TIGR03617 family F420-dependent LLM class oxidoreductase n=1 Tax=Rhodococcus sp. 14C212 TaxID=2711209 RepID=UPI0013EDA877|nr:TIGR03617 family F420-dependent LLM class oxidoreductase [Rhodococcus sp. 14C212]NGP07750.1 TIGR03617 family F420-dependent LLM class oxidoreductase [Rhodococcus sp. 14C212]
MKIDAWIREGLDRAVEDARLSEEIGFDGAWNSEAKSDAFLGLVLAAEHTQRIQLGSSIAVAFSRSPMNVAYQAMDLQRYSQGRFVLGLGPQIRPHIEDRFSMTWSKPAARMKDFVAALRSIWHSWATGEKLDHRGEFYRHTLMTPNFVPPAVPDSAPKIYLAGVGPKMLRVAAEAADGLFVHPFLTERYLHDVLLPTVAAHRLEDDAPLELALSPFVALDENDFEAVRTKMSFYGSTPAYRPVLEAHGWGDLQTDLNALSKQNRWGEMPALITDDMVYTMCSVGDEKQVAADLKRRYDGVVQRIRFNRPGDQVGPVRFAGLVDALRAVE